MTPRERADRARQLIEDPVFREAMRDIREKLIHKLEALSVPNQEAEHELVLFLQILKLIPAQFQTYADELVIERHEEKQNKFMDRVKQKFRA